MTPAQPPLPTAWNLPFQPFTGNQTSTLISESLLGLRVTATRQKSGRSLYGFAPRPVVCPGGENCPAGTTLDIVTVVSGNLRDARLSHDDPNAGTANRKTKMQKMHFIVE